ncbi:stage V sporulation protein AF [Oscillibacter sp. PC13]|uniref:spore germination protein n=1 Tax=Oscillibacter sp. PC13 TaxID=1855299 RepID=UPI0008E0CD17|nr:spore germination protein [Oscillibacter sp. PC13]SFO93608.1 stage V sporulation protein AF [Oscillibacter sp. PC13]
MEQLSTNYRENVRWFDDTLGVDRSCDLVSRDFLIGGRRGRIWVIDGYGRDAILERMGAFWLSLKPEEVKSLTEMQAFADRFITFSETNVSFHKDDIVTNVLLGKTLFLMEGLQGAALIDAKDYPSRSVGEPPDGKVLRGSHDGFIEAVVPNMALLRRRIRDPHLTMEAHKVGTRSHTDAVLCYLNDKVDESLLAEIRGKLEKIQVKSLTMAQESVAEAIRPKQWYNPFPKVRYTERPDTAAACIMEGSIILLVDNSPSVMILPTSFFDFTQEANEFYFPPLIGSYLRLLRVIVFLISLLITPLWYLMVSEPGRLPGWLYFLSSPEPASLDLLWQLLVVEFLIDVLKLASLNTPDSLSNSFSMLGALILGDFAVQAGWLGPEVLVYMAFVSVAGFAQPSYELGYAFKLLRVALLLLTAVFDIWGFLFGVAGILVLLATTKPVVGKGYLYPLIPFNGTALRRLLLREPISRDNT